MNKLNRIMIKYLENKVIEEIDEHILNEIVQKYFNSYQPDTIVIDLSYQTRFDKINRGYDDGDEEIFVNVPTLSENELFEYVKRIVKEKLEYRDFY